MPQDELNRINDPATPLDDKRAHLEFHDLFRKSNRKHLREGAINIGFIVFVWVCLLSVSAVVVIKLWHMVFPQNYCWLVKEQLNQLNDFFVDGSIGGLVVGVLKSNIMGKSDE